MKYHVKVRGVQGPRGGSSLFYSTFDIEAPDETEATRLGLIKARQRFFGTRDVSVMSAEPVAAPDEMDIPAAMRRTVAVQGGKLKYVKAGA